MSDGRQESGVQHHLYVVSAVCPVCDEVTQFVKTAETPLPVDMDVPLTGETHCPKCGVDIEALGVRWDRQAEHEVEAVEQEGVHVR